MQWLVRLCVLLASLVWAHAQAALSLQVTVATHNTAAQSDTQAPGDMQQTFQLLLAQTSITLNSGQQTTIFDFHTRRRLVIDLAAKSYVDESLFSTVAFRSLELKNRQLLLSNEDSSNTHAPVMPMVDNEHMLSLLSDKPAKISSKQVGTNWVFAGGGHTLARWSQQGHVVSGADAQRFAQFLRYALGGHPAILAKLAAGKRIPTHITLLFAEPWGSRECTLSVDQLQTAASAPIDLSSYTPRQLSGTSSPLDSLLDHAASLRPDAIQAAQADFHPDTAVQAGHMLDAMLMSLEWALMSPQPTPPLSADQRAQLNADPGVQQLLQALAAKTEGDNANAIQTLVDLRAKALDKSYVLEILEANDRVRQHEEGAARRLLTDALQKNPLLAGVYRDLGYILLGQYDPERAWRCWDIGRTLAPTLPGFNAIHQLEQDLLTQHPEYF